MRARGTPKGLVAMLFADRTEAGRRLAERLEHLRGADAVVLGLPRGGVPVAFEVAQALGAPLDVIVARKLGVPYQPELAMGAVGEGGVRVINDDVVRLSRVSTDELAEVERRERAEVDRRARRFRADHPAVSLQGRTALLIDDGVATGATARAACQVARAQGARRVVFAVPVGPIETPARLERDADDVICLEMPSPFYAIGEFYTYFPQVPDDDVVHLLRLSRTPAAAGVTADPPPVNAARDEDVTVLAGGVRLAGRLTVPEAARGVVIFAHGSGSSRHSPRNRYVAQVLQQAGLGTLLFDLLTPAEELDRGNVFDIPLLADRLHNVVSWLRAEPGMSGVAIGYFGASTGAGAALWAAAEPNAGVAAVVSRGGRPDLAGNRLPYVTAPTLLIVGGRDDVVLDLNRDAQRQMRCQVRLEIIPGATHLFEEPGTLRAAALLARDWFAHNLVAVPQPGA